MTHDVLLVHAGTTFVLAIFMWTVQVTVVPRIAHASAQDWAHHAALHRRAFRWLFWPIVVVEGCSGFGIAILRPAGIPMWLHALNLALIVTAWTATVVIRARMGHGPVAKYNPAGFLIYARLNWIRVFVWTARTGVVGEMLLLAATARQGLP